MLGLLACAGMLVGMSVSLLVLEGRGTLVYKTDKDHNEKYPEKLTHLLLSLLSQFSQLRRLVTLEITVFLLSSKF